MYFEREMIATQSSFSLFKMNKNHGEKYAKRTLCVFYVPKRVLLYKAVRDIIKQKRQARYEKRIRQYRYKLYHRSVS